MQLIVEADRQILRDDTRNTGVFGAALGFCAFSLMFLSFIEGIAWLSGSTVVNPLEVAPILVLVFGVIAVAGLFDTSVETEFDRSARRVRHEQRTTFRPLAMTLWRSRSEVAFDEVTGIGLHEKAVEGSFVYAPMICHSGGEVRLALRSGPYLCLDETLERIRAFSGLRKLDRR
jgi:hypothetical protein